MDRRHYLVGVVGALSSVAGCSRFDGNANAQSNPEPDDPLQFGEWGRVTEQTATMPDQIRFSDRIVFEVVAEEITETTWTPPDGYQYLLTHVGLRILDSPENDLLMRPNPFDYAAWVEGQAYQALQSPEKTTTIVEPIQDGYVTGDSKGATGTTSWGYLAFEIPDDVGEADVQLRYENGVDGEPLVWVPDAA